MKLLEENNTEYPTTKILSQYTSSEINPGENNWYTTQKGKEIPLKPKIQQVPHNNKTEKNQKKHPPASITTNPQPKLQHQQPTTSVQTTSLPKPKPIYHLPPPPY